MDRQLLCMIVDRGGCCRFSNRPSSTFIRRTSRSTWTARNSPGRAWRCCPSSTRRAWSAASCRCSTSSPTTSVSESHTNETRTHEPMAPSIRDYVEHGAVLKKTVRLDFADRGIRTKDQTKSTESSRHWTWWMSPIERRDDAPDCCAELLETTPPPSPPPTWRLDDVLDVTIGSLTPPASFVRADELSAP